MFKNKELAKQAAMGQLAIDRESVRLSLCVEALFPPDTMVALDYAKGSGDAWRCTGVEVSGGDGGPDTRFEPGEEPDWLHPYVEEYRP